MYPINDRQYLKICSEIAQLKSISLSAAKKKVEIQIAKKGLKTINDKRKVAEDLLDNYKKEKENGISSSKILDKLMETLESEDSFLTED